jgi:hypothetical protein
MACDSNEIVTCFVFGKRKLIKSDDQVIVKAKVFEPHRTRNDLSVFRISDLKSGSDERSIWFIGKFVERNRQSGGDRSNLYGRADLSVFQIRDLNLDVIPDETPPRHANIENFPSFSKEADSECFQIQHKLADRAEGYLSTEVLPEIHDILNENVKVKSEFSDGSPIN